MSYEPTLLIKKSDLTKYESDFENYDLEKNEDRKKVLKYLNDIYKNNYEGVFEKQTLILCRPEFSVFNENVRDLLNEWEITFTIFN